MGGGTIRQATAADRDAVYDICLRTGDLGGDATGLYDDDDLLGDVYAGPYLLLEPELALVLTDDEGVAGYTLGALDTRAFTRRWRDEWLPHVAPRQPNPAVPPETPSDHLRMRLYEPERRLPSDEILTDFPSHLHIDLLPRAQGRGLGRALITALFERLRAAGAKGVHLGVHPANERAIGFYRRCGFVELDDRGLFGRRL